METFALTFELLHGTMGWAQARISVGSVTHETAVSYLTRDPLGPLAQALIEFIWPQDGTIFVFGKTEAQIDLKQLRQRTFTWEDEPGGWRWILRPHGEAAVNVRLERLTSRADVGPLLESICSLREMAGACVDCVERLLLAHGIVGYRLKWHEGDLPLSQCLILKRWLESAQYDVRKDGAGTWHEDLELLRALGV
jgi:hypothetical protein